MATGLDRIIEQILADAEAKAAEQVAAAEEEAKKTLADAAAEAEQKANVLLDFSAQLKMAVPGTNITVSNTPCNIPDGFLLVYGGIDVNCTFASLFEAAGDTLQDLAGGMLFR